MSSFNLTWTGQSNCRQPAKVIDAEHKGAATRSVRLASLYAFDVLRWARLEILTNADNAASRRVAVKASFQLEGVLRSYGAFEKYQPLLGQRFDWAIYGRLRTE